MPKNITWRFDHCASDGSTPLGMLSTYMVDEACPHMAQLHFYRDNPGREIVSWGVASEFKRESYAAQT